MHTHLKQFLETGKLPPNLSQRDTSAILDAARSELKKRDSLFINCANQAEFEAEAAKIQKELARARASSKSTTIHTLAKAFPGATKEQLAQAAREIDSAKSSTAPVAPRAAARPAPPAAPSSILDRIRKKAGFGPNVKI